ncbi:MAG: iron ABC transporter permease [Ignisphaera sp.]|nr:iron ABC transporter permease [Ignisphaera sp.]
MALPLYERNIKHFFISLTSFTILIVFMFVLALSLGPAMLSPHKVFQAIFLKPFGYAVDDSVNVIAMLRLSRALASLLCGASLALAGLLMQTITRNPLADPYIFGLSSTALTAIALGIILAPNLMVHKAYVVIVSFLGALTGYALTLSLSKLSGGTSLAMVLAGIAIASLFSGASHILLYVVQQVIKTPYVYLLMGSASTVLLKDLYFLAFPTIILTILSLAFFKPLNAYLYGDEYAKQLGFNPTLVRDFAASIAALLTAITIAFVGVVGFIGLAAPHIARFLTGSDHKFAIPITTLVGALLTLVADIVVKLVSMFAGAVGELPLGVVTAVIGAPFLAYLIIKKVRE